MKYNFIAIEGNIGSGKTSLAKKLKRDLQASLILESFAENPFLPKFYKNPEKHAFSLELFFMAERYNQMKKREQELFNSVIISDYAFIKSKLFATYNLKDSELTLFNRLFEIMNASVLRPQFVIYLYASIERLQENIKKRGRDFEQNITDEYLQNIQSNYLDYLRKQKAFPVLIIDVTDIDFLKDNKSYNQIKSALEVEYQKTIYHLNITPPKTLIGE